MNANPPIWPLPRVEFMPLNELDEDRDVCVVTTKAAWAAAHAELRLKDVSHIEIGEASQPAWDALAGSVRGDVIYAVGGGLAVDAAKYLGSKTSTPVVSVPTALSVDAFLTWAAGIREDGCVRYLVTGPPERLIVDWELIAKGPASIRAAGICDVLSIATGRWDWNYAEERGANPPGMNWIDYVDRAAAAILEGALDCAEAAGRGDAQGLKQLLDCLALEVQLCNQIGHSRPEEGSEHYFAYSVENEMGHGLPHGDLVGPGIVMMAAAQGQDVAPLKRALNACHIPLNNIPGEVSRQTLGTLPGYCRKRRLPHGIAHDLKEDQIEGLLKSLA